MEIFKKQQIIAYKILCKGRSACACFSTFIKYLTTLYYYVVGLLIKMIRFF